MKMMRERRGPTREKIRTGHIVRSVDTSGVETQTVYDALGRPVMVLGYEPEADPLTGTRVIFEEQFYAYVEPDPISATPGYTYTGKDGSAPSISLASCFPAGCPVSR